jgi:hypothetical protein
MAYKVLKSFVDLQDNNYRYRVGDTFPHANKTVSEERLAELASGKNKLRQPLIKAVVEKIVEPEPIEVEPAESEPIETVEVADVPVEEADELVEEPKVEKPKRRGRPPKAKTAKE